METDVFEEIEKTRGTGWQYELHQLKNDNRKLREQIAAAREAGPSSSSRRLSGSNEPGRGKSIPKRKREVAPAPTLPVAGPGPSSSSTFALAPPPPPNAYSSSNRDSAPAPAPSSYQHLASYPYQAPQPQQQQQQHYYQPQPPQQLHQQQQQATYPHQTFPQNFTSSAFAGPSSGGGGAVGAGGQPSYAEYSQWMAMQARGKGGGQQ